MFKNYRLYRLYRRLVKEHSKELLEQYNVRVDQVGRLYTVVNLPPQADTYGPKDGPRITAALLKTWLTGLDNFLVKIGLKELTQVDSMTEIDEMNYLLVIRFKFLDVARIASTATIVAVILTSCVIISTLVFFMIKLFM